MYRFSHLVGLIHMFRKELIYNQIKASTTWKIQSSKAFIQNVQTLICDFIFLFFPPLPNVGFHHNPCNIILIRSNEQQGPQIELSGQWLNFGFSGVDTLTNTSNKISVITITIYYKQLGTDCEDKQPAYIR